MAKHKIAVTNEELFEMNETMNVKQISEVLKQQGRPLGTASIYLRFARVHYAIKFHYKPNKKYVPRR